jgi:broad specificity phosphatase PhoE
LLYTLTTIDLLRHGEPEGGEMFRGDTDLPLTPLGWQQMQQAVASMHLREGQLPWQRIISSPLLRCQQFAGELASRHALRLVLEPGIREISFGDWDGCSVEQVRNENEKLLHNFWQNPLLHTPPNGETLQHFQQRVLKSWDALLEVHRGEHLLLVCHGGVMRVLLAAVLDMPLKAINRLSVPYACLSRVKIHHAEGFPEWLQLEFHQGPSPQGA